MTTQTDASTDYWPIYIARSDGQAYTNLDHIPLSADEDQDVTQQERWEVIVAGHLQNQAGPRDDKRQYKLAGFPKGYELRCAVRKDGARDYYLYGHPAGPKANFRTPGEFALHALWLVSDSKDNNQCPWTTSLTNVFRVGELVWYKHTAWRLGVVLAITPKPNTQASLGAPDSAYHFTLAPLGHMLLTQNNLIKDCQSMRPFLTFSVPNTTIDELKDKTFSTANWAALAARYSQDSDPNNREINRQVLGLEASKMGARAINDSFSTIDLLAHGTTADGAYHIQHYGGLYLGAELIRVGDPLRVTTPLQQQPELAAAGVPPDATLHAPPNPPIPRQPLPHRPAPCHATHAPNAVAPESLTPAFAEELATRVAVEKDKGMRWSWVLVAPDTVRGEQDVLGRFYVTEKLMSVIDPARLQAWVQRTLSDGVRLPL
ncbi:hypothetical protein N0V88_002885 [Collariella sp. IMI 366227]|nr:hypothetical protein N0V88_002885 [Collariella sp. IMI 366227]